MTKLEITKFAVKFIVGSGTSTIVHAIIKNNVQPANITQQVTVVAASIALGAMVADVTTQYTYAQIDAIADWYYENVKK